MTFLSADGALHCETATDIPLDFLHSRHVAGVAPHKLVLKPGAIVILLIMQTQSYATSINDSIGCRHFEIMILSDPFTLALNPTWQICSPSL